MMSFYLQENEWSWTEMIMLNKTSQMQKDKYPVFPLM